MNSKFGDKAGYVALSGIFNVALALFCWWRRPGQIGLKDWGLLALATFRLSRMLAYDKVMETYRAPVVETVPHDSGAGLTTQARSDATGFKKALGEMIACPICNGTWISALLVYGMCFAPNLTRTLVTIMSAVGASEIMQAAFEKIQWEGELARHQAGEQMRVNRAAQPQAAPLAPELKLRKRA
ncbi:MAG: DUF1360 domain-containing protein [Anaerolineae bacterium]|jgi:hypothetical protein|nr:DUF1360 domain-containing protein [Anaerolineae bacterium]